MEKKYTAPEIKVIEFDIEDIIQTSGIIVNGPKTFDGATELETKEIDIFG